MSTANRVFVTYLLLGAAACGGGGGGGGDGGLPPLSLLSSTPSDGATNASRAMPAVLTFSAPLNATTATPSNVSLEAAGGSQSIMLSVSGAELTVVPAKRLLPLTPYTLRVNAGLRGRGGESLAAPLSIAFTTLEGQWGAPAFVEANQTSDAVEPKIAVDADGNALAVFVLFDGRRNSVWANRYTVGSGWGTAVPIQATDGNTLQWQVAIDATGDALAVWSESTGGRFSIWSNRYTTGTGWGTATLVENDDAGHAILPQIAFDATGNALAIWEQEDGPRYSIWSNRWTIDTGWGTATRVENNDSGNAHDAQIAVDASGDALAVWAEQDGANIDIWSNRSTAGAWGTAVRIETATGTAGQPRIAVDKDSNALAVWFQADGSRFSTWSNRYTAGSDWGTAELIENDDRGDAFSPQIAFDASGNALAVWWQAESPTITGIWSNRYTAGSGWGTPVRAQTDTAHSAEDPQLVFDASGNALAVWEQSDGALINIVWNRYKAGAGWGTEALAETNDIGDALQPRIAIDSTGNALAVWAQGEEVRFSVASARFE